MNVKRDQKGWENGTRTTQKRTVLKGQGKNSNGNDDTTIPGTNQAGPTQNTHAQVGAQQAASTAAVSPDTKKQLQPSCLMSQKKKRENQKMTVKIN